MTSGNIYNVVIIGAGPGGYATAIHAAQHGLRVALVEKKYAGGVCLNEGCIPSKIWLNYAHLIGKLKAARELGILTFSDLMPHAPALQEYLTKKVRMLRNGIEGLEKANGATFIKGSARIVSAQDVKQVEVTAENGDVTQLQSTHLIIATGARPRIFDWAREAYDGVHVLTYEQVLFQNEIPESLVVIGGGAIGLEMADAYAALGSRVHVLEAMPSILMNEDAEVRDILAKALRNREIEITTGVKITRVSLASDGKGCEIQYEKDGESHAISSAKVLLATGIIPHTEGLGLEASGIALDKAGFIAVNSATQETNVPGVYAIGDVARGRFAHEAEAQGERVIGLIAGSIDSYPVNPRLIPGCVFTDPQVASFGLKEEEAKAERPGHDIRVGKARYEQIGRGIALNDRGLLKIVVDYSSSGGEVLGAHVVGPAAEYIVSILSSLLWQEPNLASVKRIVFIHPTLPEVIKEAVADVEGKALHALPRKK